MTKKQARKKIQRRNKRVGQNYNRANRSDIQTQTASDLKFEPFTPVEKDFYQEGPLEETCCVCEKTITREEIESDKFGGFSLFHKDYLFHTEHFHADDPTVLKPDARENMYMLRLKLAAEHFPELFTKQSL